MRGIFVFFFIASSIIVVAKGDIDYNNKMVFKTLVKAGNMINPALNEILVPDDIAEVYALNGKFFEVESENNSSIKTIYIGRVNSCRSGGCSINNPEMGGESEYFDYMVCFDAQCTVVVVKVFNYQATHGHEVTAKGWLKQFEGHSPNENLEAGKNIDSISGATISVNGITRDIEEKTCILNKIKNL